MLRSVETRNKKKFQQNLLTKEDVMYVTKGRISKTGKGRTAIATAIAVILLAAVGRAADAAELNIVARDCASGIALDGASVTLLSTSVSAGRTRTTDAKGAATFGDLAFDSEYSVLVEKHGYTGVVRSGIKFGATEIISQAPNVPDVYATGATLEVYMFPLTANLSGNVWYEDGNKNAVLATGQPITVRVEIDGKKAYTEFFEANCAENTGGSGACDFVNAVKKGLVQITKRYWTATTDTDDGSFSFDGLPAAGDGYNLWISAGSFGGVEYSAASFSVADLNTPLLSGTQVVPDRSVIFKLTGPSSVAFRPNSVRTYSAMPQISARGRTLTVKNQSPSAPVQLRVLDLRGRTVGSFSVAQSDVGAFTLTNIPAGRYIVEARRSGVHVGTAAVLVR
jgi:hypothetical protein